MKRKTAGFVVGGLVAVSLGSFVAHGFVGDGLSKSVTKELKSVAKDYGRECNSIRNSWNKQCKSHEKAAKKNQVTSFTAFYTCYLDTGSALQALLSATQDAQNEAGEIVQEELFLQRFQNVTIANAAASEMKVPVGDYTGSVEKSYEGCDAFFEKGLLKIGGKLNKKDACINVVWNGLPDLKFITPNAVSDAYVQSNPSPGIIWHWTAPDSRFPGDPTSYFCHVIGSAGDSNFVSCRSPFGSNSAEVFPDPTTGLANCEFAAPPGNCETYLNVGGVDVDCQGIGSHFTLDDDDG